MMKKLALITTLAALTSITSVNAETFVYKCPAPDAFKKEKQNDNYLMGSDPTYPNIKYKLGIFNDKFSIDSLTYIAIYDNRNIPNQAHYMDCEYKGVNIATYAYAQSQDKFLGRTCTVTQGTKINKAAHYTAYECPPTGCEVTCKD